MSEALYLDTSAVLRAVLEQGTSPDVEDEIRQARALITSRLSLVESTRAFHRIRQTEEPDQGRLAEAERQVGELWSRCEIWELTREVCDLASGIAPRKLLRTLDALHLATFVLARREVGKVTLLTTDARLRRAAAGA